MPNESHSLIWPVLLLTVLALGIGIGGHALMQNRSDQAAGSSGCAGQREERQARRADWGWNVFDNGAGSPSYAL